jgi:uroporphyrinogen-III decarboxylase
MTHYERIHLAMARERPDRVPVMCQLSQEFMAIRGGVDPFRMYYNAEGAAAVFIALREAFGFDGVLLNTCFPDNWRETFESVTLETPGGAERYRFPDGRVLERRGHQLALVAGGQGPPARPCLASVNPAELPLRLDYTDAMALHRLVVAQGRRDGFSVHGEIVSPFDCLCVLLGLEDAMVALIEDPAKCEAVLEGYIPQCFAFAKAQLDTGVDVMKISSPFAGGSFISRDHYARFVAPFERELVRRVHAYRPGTPVYTHTCGFIGDRLELMAATGIDGLECMDPPPLGNTELADAKKRVGGRLFLKGNMDSVNVLLRATPESVEPYVRAMIEAGGEGGGYILSTACSVAPWVDPAVLKRLVPLAERYGGYE